MEVLKRLRAMGITMGIDDFGTGYSSLGYLNRFPLDGLKIDRTLVSDVWSSAGAAAITTAVVAIGRSLNLRVVAEGVETEDQMIFLKKQGCDLIQGFFFSRPLQPSAFEVLLRAPRLYGTTVVSDAAPSLASEVPGIPAKVAAIPPGPAIVEALS